MELRSDCSRCAALCCAAFAFEAGPDFAEDKPAGDACRHLSDDHRCTIHARRGDEGYHGCASYDCLGAGQAATALFPPARTEEAGAVRRARFESFRILRTIHALAATLQRPDLAPDLAAELLPELAPAEGWSYSALLDFDRSDRRSVILSRVARGLAAAARSHISA